MTLSLTNKILAEVHAERIRQNEKWGVQRHPFFYPGLGAASRKIYHTNAETLKRTNAQRVKILTEDGFSSDKNCTWDTILLEEVYEALSEHDPKLMRDELIQVAAVAVAMIERIEKEEK